MSLKNCAVTGAADGGRVRATGAVAGGALKVTAGAVGAAAGVDVGAADCANMFCVGAARGVLSDEVWNRDGAGAGVLEPAPEVDD